MAKRVAVVGLAFRFPNTTAETYWSDLLNGRNLITEVAPGRWSVDAYLHPDKKHPGTAYTKAAGSIGDIAGFDAGFFGISPREAALMDPQQRVLMELCWEAIESANMQPAHLRGSDCGVYVGIASTDYAYRIADDMEIVDAHMATGNTPSIAANRLSYFYDLHGPSIAIDTACSSSMVAFHQACRAITSGECGQAIAGGISLHLHPYGFIGFTKTSMLSPRGRSHVFDAAADGYVRAEGGGLFLLKDYDQAQADGDPIWAVVAGTAVNTDGRKSGLTIPSAKAQIALMQHAYAQAGITPNDIDYLEAHGTGTPVGDPIETHAIGIALGQPRGAGNPMPIGSVKSNMGHLETASGVAGLVKAIYALRHRVVPATIGVDNINPHIQLDAWNIDILTTNRPLRSTGRLVIGVNSFGFGGANAHVILQSPPQAKANAKTRSTPGTALPLVLTGQTAPAVRDFAARLADTLDEQSPGSFYDAAWQLARRRQWHAERVVLFAANRDEASARLRAFATDTLPARLLATGTAVPCQTDGDAGTIGPVFVYSGNGSQWIGMGARLLGNAMFAGAVAEVDATFQPLAGYSLADELAGKNGSNDHENSKRYDYTEIAQPALFALQVGVTRMLAQYGVMPAAVMGHSVGEVAAAWACGALSLADAVQVIFHRSRLQGQTKGSGAMTAVGLSAEQTQALLESLALTSALHVAGANSARGATVAGAPAALEVLENHLAEQRIFSRRLKLDYAFHSPAMDSLEDGIKQSLASLKLHTGSIAFYSTVTGARLEGCALSGDYWWRNIRMPVQFAPAVEAAIADHHNIFVEVGPHAVLRSYLNDLLSSAQSQGRVIVTIVRDDDEPERIATTAGHVITSGAHIDWPTLFPQRGHHFALPAYAWQRERHWHPVSPESQGLLMREIQHPLLGYALSQHESTWQQQLDTQSHPILADHMVGDAVVFPGAGFAELALAAALQWQPGEYAEVEELEIRAPLLLAHAPSKIVRVALDSTDGRIHIRAKEQGAQPPWTLHATGRVLQTASAALLNRPVLCPPTATPDFTSVEHTALTRAVGLNYGPAFQAIAHGWRESADTVLAALAPPACLNAELSCTHLHPALLDCAFQLIVHLLKDDAPSMRHGIAFVPIKIGRLALHTGHRPCYARVQLLGRAPRSLNADIVLYDEHCAVLAVAQDVRFRAVRLRKHASDHLNFLHFVATPRPLAHTGAPAVIDAALLRQHLLESMANAPADACHARFSGEVEPLLESLCDRYAADALAANGNTLDAATLQSWCARAPERTALLQHVLDRAVACGYAQAVENGWVLSQSDIASAADIWNTLLREYPDYFPAIRAVGRVGLHLPALLQGQIAADAVCPPAMTPAALDRLTRGTALTRQLTASVAAVLSAAQQRLRPGQRLAVLEVGGDTPVLAAVCANTLDINLADVCYATPNAVVATHVQRQFSESKLNASVEVIETTDVQTTVLPGHDLAILHGAFDTLDTARQTLTWTLARLKPGGVLLLLGRTPAPWVDFLFGVRAPWWCTLDHPSGQLRSTQQSPQDWQACMQALDLQVDKVLRLGGEQDTGLYALIASLPATDATTAAPAVTARGIVLLADARKASDKLARALHTYLIKAGHRCQVITWDTTQDVNAEHLDTALQTARAQLGDMHAIVHLHGWGAAHAHMSAQTLTHAQVQRCALAATLVQVCTRAHPQATLWLFTSGAAQSMPNGSHAPAADIDLFALNDAALWGYGRALVNEAEAANCRVRLLDIAADITPRLLDAITQELTHGDAEDEILLDASGARTAPRLRELASPRTGFQTHEKTHDARLGFEFPGQLRNLRWESVTPPPPANDELQVRIHATGLNFRDVMYTLGMLSDEAVENGFVGPSLGLEFAGIVTQVGSNIHDYQPGDAVVGFGPASFSTLTLTRANAIARIPQGFSFEAAATIPSTFFTVYYALHHLARLQAGEKILIHGAAGGVGIAAVQFAQACGAEIYATAGSDEKRDFLRLMGVHHIYDSRTLTYADEILADTNGHGIDVVLNSLAGEAINRNFRVLKPFGRFLELGKRDFYENTHIGLRPFRNNISYFGIDADQLMRERPELTRRLFGELIALFEQGALHPLPYTVFDANEVVHAFRHMQQAQQIGKIVVTYRNGIQHIHETAPANTSIQTLCLPTQASYLVTGGLGGFGLRSAQWLAEKGARHLILISRSGPREAFAQTAIAELQAQGVHVHAVACDITDRAALAALLDETATTLPPLKGIIHAAAVIEDSLAVNATPTQIEHNFAAKVLGARHLHELTHNTPLDFCIYYSSATTLFGNPGQSAYIAANTWLEALATQRRAQGLPATCVRWGAIDDVGFLARNERIKHALQERMGGAALASRVALQALEDILLADASDLGVLELDWRTLRRFLPGAAAPKFADLARYVDDDDQQHGSADDIVHLLATLDDEALHAHLAEMLKAELGEILRIPTSKIDTTRSIYDMGLDSLMGVELVVALENRLGLRLPVMALNENPTVDTLALRLIRLLRSDEAQSTDEVDEMTAAVAHIAASHAADVSKERISAFARDIKNGDVLAPQKAMQRIIQ